MSTCASNNVNNLEPSNPCHGGTVANGTQRSYVEVMKLASSQPFAVGDRVKHLRFGSGTVQSIDGTLVLVIFDGRVGQRKVGSGFLEPSKGAVDPYPFG